METSLSPTSDAAIKMGADEVRKFLPKEGFLSQYFEEALPITDAPAIFHVASAYSALSMVMTQVHFPFGINMIRPNVWMLILAPTTFYRKSTSLSFASQILTSVDPSLLFPNEFSSEAFIKSLAERPEGSGGGFIWSEFGGVLASMNKTYMQGIHQMLADIYDCPPFYRRRLQKEDIYIKSPYFSILGASSLAWFAEQARSKEMINGGFLTRFMYFLGTEKEQWHALPKKLHQTTVHELATMLSSRRMLGGEMYMPDSAATLFAAWARKKEMILEAAEKSGEFVTAIFRRSVTNCLKISMLNAADRMSLEISDEDVQMAISMIDSLYLSTKSSLSSELQVDSFMRDIAKAKEVMADLGSCQKTVFCRRMSIHPRRFDDIMRYLKDIGFVLEKEKEWEIGNGGKRKSLFYYINDEYYAKEKSPLAGSDTPGVEGNESI